MKGYLKLAAAIIKSGYTENDKEFTEEGGVRHWWYEILLDYIKDKAANSDHANRLQTMKGLWGR